MTQDWYPLDASVTAGVDELGGKGHNLIALKRAGFAVPGGLVLTTALYARALKKGPASFFATQKETPPPFSAELSALLGEGLKAFPPQTRFAVRSSGSDEDAGDTSFAGQHETILNVQGLDALVQAVLDCWASLGSTAANAYRAAQGRGGDAQMAVVVQEMVDAQCAGVMFTRHPVRPDLDRVVVECVGGLGDQLVGGTVMPDRVEFDRSGRRLLEAVHSADGLHSIDRIRDVDFVALATRLEDAFAGKPQDIEWAHDGKQFYLLQARPITTLRRPKEVWTRIFGDEFWAEATTPLQYTCLGRWIREDYFFAVRKLMGTEKLISGDPFTRIHSHIYFNSQYLYNFLPLIPPTLRIPRFFNWLPPYWLAELQQVPETPLVAVRGQLLARLRDSRASMLSHYRMLDGYIAGVEKAFAGTLRDDLNALDDDALWQRLQRADDFGRRHFQFIRWGMGTYLFPLKLMVVRAGMDWADDTHGIATEMLLTAEEDNRTVSVNRELEALAAHARALPALAALFAAGGRVAREDCAAVAGSGQFIAALDAFLVKHGHRGTTRELHMPRWMDDPSLVLGLVTAYVNSPHAHGAKQLAPQREDAGVAEWLRRIRGSHALLGVARAWWAQRLLQLARAYIGYRENQRYALDFILTEMRHLMLDVAARLVRAGLLAHADDIFFLEWDEVQRLWARRQSPGAGERIDVGTRREEFLRDAASLPADWIIDGVEYGGGTQALEGDGSRMIGTGASAGKFTGRARVVHSPQELGHVREGEVMIAPNTDPGWTPVFPLIKGLVLETGGMLSHGAIVAREYGIPAVTGVARACSRIKDGDLVEVDGGSGVIRIL
jgi:phosphohistidine swiveling domain-containing protein